MSENSENKTEEDNKDSASSETLQSEAEKYKNEYLYLRAEFENYKRNAIKERSEILKYGAERVVIEILNVLDNFERALSLKVTPESLQTYLKGIEMTSQDLKSALAKIGVQEVPSLGEAFDPKVHEALGSEETTEVPEGHILRVFKKPYKLNDKVIRPGQVVIAKKQTEN